MNDANADYASTSAAEANDMIPAVWDDDTANAVVRKVIFAGEISPAVVAKHIGAAMDAAMNHYKVDVKSNVRQDVEQPDGYVPAILKISKHDEVAKKHVVQSVFIGQVPSLGALWETEAGQGFVQNAVGMALLKQVTDAIKNDDPIPFKLEEFITSRGQELEGWKNCKSDMVKLLRKRGLPAIDANSLEMCLRSQSHAESGGYRNVPVAQWELVLTTMIGLSKTNGWNTLAMSNWLETRNEQEIEFGELDLTGIDTLFASPTPPAPEAVEAPADETEE